MTEMNLVSYQGRKICIGYPSGDNIPPEFVTSFIQMIGPSLQMLPGIQIGTTNQVSSRIAVNRNMIVENARQIGATDILWVDADMKFPIHGLAQLISHDKEIVCATACVRKGSDRRPIGLVLDKDEIKPYDQLVRMKQIGLPFMLTKMSVFDKLDSLGLAKEKCYFAEPPRWMMRQSGWEIEGHDTLVAEDEYFCYIVRKTEMDIWCDMELTMQIGHVGSHVHYVEQQQPPAKLDMDLGSLVKQDNLTEEQVHREAGGIGE